MDAGLGEGGVEVGAGGGVLRQPDVADAGEIGGGEAGPAGEGVVGADREHPGQFHDGALLDAPHGGADGDPGEVEVAGGEGVEAAAAGVLGLELQTHRGMAAAEGDDGVGHEVPHGRGTGGDAHGAAPAPYEVLHAAQGAVEAGDAVGGRRQDDAAGLGGHDAAGVALQEAGAGLLLQAADVLADGGLGAAEVARDGAEAAGAADGHEHAEVVEGHETQAIPWVWGVNRRIDLGVGVDHDRCRARAATRPRLRHGIRTRGGRQGRVPTHPGRARRRVGISGRERRTSVPRPPGR